MTRASRRWRRTWRRSSGAGNTYPDLLETLAQFEARAAGLTWRRTSGASQYGVFANKCWPSFEKYFGFIPCYINSRLAAHGIPISCEVGYLRCAERVHRHLRDRCFPPAILDINNTVPYDMIAEARTRSGDYAATRSLDGLPLRQHLVVVHGNIDDEVPAHHAPHDGAGQGAEHHTRDAGRTDQDRR